MVRAPGTVAERFARRYAAARERAIRAQGYSARAQVRLNADDADEIEQELAELDRLRAELAEQPTAEDYERAWHLIESDVRNGPTYTNGILWGSLYTFATPAWPLGGQRIIDLSALAVTRVWAGYRLARKLGTAD